MSDERAKANRDAYPGIAAIVDIFRETFGPVRVLHGIENGREIGKPQPFEGIDVDKLIRWDDWRKTKGLPE